MKEGKTKQIDELVDQVLLKEHEVCMIWPEVVGQMIASRTKSVRVMDGKLFVSFTSAVVRNEIMMVKEGLIRALNEKVGKEVVKEMIIN